MRRVILAVVSTATALVFLLSFKTHTSSALAAAPAASAVVNPVRSSASASPKASRKARSKPSASSAAPATAAAPATSAAPTVKTVTGKEEWTQYGPVEVRITVANGKITRAAAILYPTESQRDVQINSYAIPQLNSEAVAAGSAQIDSVSGATYTSNGYIGSLQSAVDQAGL